MLAFVRKMARSWVAGILFGLLIISFLFWGINDVFTGGNKDNVAIIDGDGISSAEFKTEFDRMLKSASENAQRTISTQEALEAKQDVAVLNQMVEEKVFSKFLKKLGINISDERLRAEIEKIPAFQEPGTNKFSQNVYQSLLAENKYTVAQFEDSVRTDMARQLLTVAATSGLRAPKYFASQTLAFNTERRNVVMIPVTASMVGTPPVPTDADIQKLYNENKQRLMRPETRDLTLVVASVADFIPKAKVDEAQVHKVFEIQKPTHSTPATRSFIQIVAPTQAKADEAAKALQSGKEPAQITKELGLQAPLSFNAVSVDKVPDKEVAKAVFAAKTGAVAAVKGALSFSAYKISAATEGKAADFTQVAPQIREQLAKEAAGQLLTDATTTYDDLISQGENVETAATKAGFKIVKLANIVKTGEDINTGQKPAILTGLEKSVSDVFGMAKGDATELNTAKDDTYVALRVDNIKVTSPIPLAEVKQEIATEWVKRALSDRVKAKADEIVKAAKATSMDEAAKKFGLKTIKAPAPLTRGQGSAELSELIFGAKKGDIVTGPVANGVDYAIVKIETILRDDETKAKDRLDMAETNVRTSVQRDIMTAVTQSAKNRMKTKIYSDRLARIFGDNNADNQSAN